MKLFPATEPFEMVAIDILGELIRSPRGNRYILVITDRFSKLVQTVPLKRITAAEIAKAFVNNWVFVYGPPKKLLSDNGTQFTSRTFQSICNILGIQNLFTTTYHPQANGQVERFNRTLLAALRHYVADHPRDWEMFKGAVTYVYNTQPHTTTKIAPFELVLSKPPVPISVQSRPKLAQEQPDPSKYMQKWRSWLRTLMSTAGAEMRKAQDRYKRNFEHRMRRSCENITKGTHVFIRKEYFSKEHPKHKLAPLADGPYEVIDCDDKTVVVEIGNQHERISRDRIVKSPTPTPSATVKNDDISNEGETTSGDHEIVLDVPPPTDAAMDRVEKCRKGTITRPRWKDVSTQGLKSTLSTGVAEADGATRDIRSSVFDDNRNKELQIQPRVSSENEVAQEESRVHIEDEKVPDETEIEERLPNVTSIGEPLFSPSSQNAVDGQQEDDLEDDNENEQDPIPDDIHQNIVDDGETQKENQEYVMGKIVNMGEDANGQPLFEIKWYGYPSEDNTWEPVSHIPRSHIVRYCKRKSLDLPENIRDAQVG
ncbi:MAG: DDE-type integrase/transposase/recombinase [Sphaerochaetaceae bacterium]